MVNITLDSKSLIKINTALMGIDNVTKNRLAVSALRAGAKPVRAKGRTNILTMVSGSAKFRGQEKGYKGRIKAGEIKRIKEHITGKMRKALVTRSQHRRSLPKGQKGVNVTMSADYNDDFVHISKSGNRTYIPTAIEYGHKMVIFGNKTGRRVAPIPFLRRAWDATKHTARKIIVQKMWEGIKAEAAKGNR